MKLIEYLIEGTKKIYKYIEHGLGYQVSDGRILEAKTDYTARELNKYANCHKA